MEEKKLRICIDLDGTICTIKKPNETYADVKVQPGAKEFIDKNSNKEIVLFFSVSKTAFL